MSLDEQELAERLLRRCSPTLKGLQLALLEDAIRNDTPDALIDLILLGVRAGDLQPDEVEAGLELARSGMFRQSGPEVVAELSSYQRAYADPLP